MAATKLGALIVAVATLAFAAPLATRAATGAAHPLTMDGTTFKPSQATIRLGDTVVWTNNDPFPHTATATGGAFDSKPLAPGKSFTFKPAAKGDYPYKCTLHPTMRGTLHVQ